MSKGEANSPFLFLHHHYVVPGKLHKLICNEGVYIEMFLRAPPGSENSRSPLRKMNNIQIT